MKCPYCGVHGETNVIDTTHDAHGSIRRRRECKACGKRFSTVERTIMSTPLVVKSSGERQEFDREKIVRGIRVASIKRPVSDADIHRLIDRIESHLQSLGRDEAPAHIIGDMVVEGLRELDPITYIRYAIVYLGLDNLEAVRAETDKLLTEQHRRRRRASRKQS